MFWSKLGLNEEEYEPDEEPEFRLEEEEPEFRLLEEELEFRLPEELDELPEELEDEPDDPFELDEEPEEEPLFSALPIAPAIALPMMPPISPKFAIAYTPFVHNKSRNFRPCFCI